MMQIIINHMQHVLLEFKIQQVHLTSINTLQKKHLIQLHIHIRHTRNAYFKVNI